MVVVLVVDLVAVLGVLVLGLVPVLVPVLELA